VTFYLKNIISSVQLLFKKSYFHLSPGEKSGKKFRGKSGRKFGRRCLRPICKCRNQAYPAVFRSLAGFHDLSIGLLGVGPMRTTVWRGCSPYFDSIYQFPVYPQSFKIVLIFSFN